MLRSPNSATPLTGVTDVVPESLPPTGLVPIATVTLAVKLVSTLPRVSCTWTWTAGVITLPGVAVLGWTLKTRTSVAVPPVVPMAIPRVSGSVPGKQPTAARATRAMARGASFISIRRLPCQECSRLLTAIERPVREQRAPTPPRPPGGRPSCPHRKRGRRPRGPSPRPPGGGEHRYCSNAPRAQRTPRRPEAEPSPHRDAARAQPSG